MFSRLHHVAIIVSDYQKARSFYVDILGLPVIRENVRPDKQDCKLDLQLCGCELELFYKPNSPARPTYPEACGLRHLAFAVQDVEQAVCYLHSKGVETQPIRYDEFSGKRFAFCFDPDGLPIELHE